MAIPLPNPNINDFDTNDVQTWSSSKIVKDVNEDIQSYISFSNDERVVGTDLDGNTLYEKTLKFNNVAITQDNDTCGLLHGITDINNGYVVEAYNDLNGTEEWCTCLNCIATTNAASPLQWKIGSKSIYMLAAAGLSYAASTSRSYLFKIRYTKS